MPVSMPSRVAQPELVVAGPYYRPMHRASLVTSATSSLPSWPDLLLA
jgi:hypothetical protein